MSAVSDESGRDMYRSVIDLGLDKEGTFCPIHQNLEGHLKH